MVGERDGVKGDAVMKRWWIGVIAVVTVTAAAWAAYAITVEVLVRQTIADFAQRPELENWVLPSIGTERPAAWAAVIAALIVTGVWCAGWLLAERGPRHRHSQLATADVPAATY